MGGQQFGFTGGTGATTDQVYSDASVGNAVPTAVPTSMATGMGVPDLLSRLFPAGSGLNHPNNVPWWAEEVGHQPSWNVWPVPESRVAPTRVQ